MNILFLLKKAISRKIICPLDYFFCCSVAQKESQKIMLLSACIHYWIRMKHTCLPISYFEEQKIFYKKENNALIKKIWKTANLSKNFKPEIFKSSIISNGNRATPLIFLNEKIYFYKTWIAEKKIFKFISQSNNIKIKQLTSIKEKIITLLKKCTENSQKIAIILSTIKKITFIIGGPGTGKTTIVSNILEVMMTISKKKIKIQLAATTGKAANHLTESIKKCMLNIPLFKNNKRILISPAITLHRLLKINNIQNTYSDKKNTVLDIDILIIDESSMIDIFVMEKLIDNISKKTRIIFLGDHNQLPSINCGHVLKDIYSYYKHGYSENIIKIINYFNIFEINHVNSYKFSNINDKICILTKNYRFNIKSNIFKVSKKIIQNTSNNFKKLFLNNYRDIKFYSLKTKDDYKKMISKLVENYENYWNILKEKNMPLNAILNFKKYRLMCIFKNGPFGVEGLNKEIEKRMKKLKFIQNNDVNSKEIYFGQPILILKNNYTIKLYNGDVGVIMYDHNKELKAFFCNHKEKTRSIPINLLPKFQTNWATTVHKTQGSEFYHSTLVLPNFDSEILTKELIYTAVTRPKKKLTVYSSKKIFLRSIQKETKRCSGLSINECSY